MLKGVGRRISMGKAVEKTALYTSLALALLVAPYSGGQQVEAAAIFAQIITGKKAFISNGGVDSAGCRQRADESSEPCNRFSAAMKSWGRYELVAAPAEALKYASPLQLQIWEKPRFMNPSWDYHSLTARHTSYCGRSESP